MVSYPTVHYAWDSESDFESEPEPYFKGRFVRTINDVDDSDSDLDDKFMLVLVIVNLTII